MGMKADTRGADLTADLDVDLTYTADPHTGRLMRLMEEAAGRLPETEDGMISMFTIGGRRFEIFHAICAAIGVLEGADQGMLSRGDAAYREILIGSLAELIREERSQRLQRAGRV